jgi:hypothetical protein
MAAGDLNGVIEIGAINKQANAFLTGLAPSNMSRHQMILNGLKLAIKYGKFYYTINYALSCPARRSIFKPSGNRLATRKMRPNQNLAHVG